MKSCVLLIPCCHHVAVSAFRFHVFRVAMKPKGFCSMAKSGPVLFLKGVLQHILRETERGLGLEGHNYKISIPRLSESSAAMEFKKPRVTIETELSYSLFLLLSSPAELLANSVFTVLNILTQVCFWSYFLGLWISSLCYFHGLLGQMIRCIADAASFQWQRRHKILQSLNVPKFHLVPIIFKTVNS